MDARMRTSRAMWVALAILLPPAPGAARAASPAPSPPAVVDAIRRVREHRTASGKTIDALIEATVTRGKVTMRAGFTSRGEPEWVGHPGLTGIRVICRQGAVFYQNAEGGHGDGMVQHAWLVKPERILSIPPNDLDPAMAVMADDTQGVIETVRSWKVPVGLTLDEVLQARVQVARNRIQASGEEFSDPYGAPKWTAREATGSGMRGHLVLFRWDGMYLPKRSRAEGHFTAQFYVENGQIFTVGPMPGVRTGLPERKP